MTTMATHTQQLLAKVVADHALMRAAQVDRRTPQEQLLDCIEEAIRDARAGRAVLEEAGLAGCVEHVALCSRVSRWEAVLRMKL